MAFPYCYVRVGRGWLSTVQSYFLLHVVVLSLTYSNNFLEYCEYDSEVGEHVYHVACVAFMNLGCVYGIVVRTDTVLSFMYDMCARRVGPFGS